jgi:hypothetical protein
MDGMPPDICAEFEGKFREGLEGGERGGRWDVHVCCRVDELETELEKLWLDEAFKKKYSKSAFTLKQLMIALDRLD